MPHLLLKHLGLLALILVVFTSPTHGRAHNRIKIDPNNLSQMKSMALSMDRTADPCTDFHKYACGSGSVFIDNVAFSYVATFFKLQEVLEEEYPQPKIVNQSYTDKIQMYIKSRKETENFHFIEYLNEIKPLPTEEWPLLEDLKAYAEQGTQYTIRPWTEDDADVFSLLGHLFSYGLQDVLFSVSIVYEDDLLTVQITPATPQDIPKQKLKMLLRDMKLPLPLVEKYVLDYAVIHQEVQMLCRKYHSAEEYNAVPFILVKLLPELKGIAPFVEHLFPERLDLNWTVTKFHMPFFQELLAKQRQPEEARQWCNYLMMNFLMDLLPTMEEMIYTDTTLKSFGLGMNYLFQKHVYEPNKLEMEQTYEAAIQAVLRQFSDTIKENHLNLSEEQNKEILAKLNNITLNIGNLPTNVSESMVEEYYSTLPDMDPENYYKNELALRRHSHYEHVFCPPGMFCWAHSPNAFYSPFNNTIIFPFYSAMSPMFERSWHPIFIMGNLGLSIGHELMHAIDTHSLNDDKFTPSFQGDCLKVPSINNTVTCLIQQNPTINIDERLADVIGSQLGYRTYEREYAMQPNFTKTSWQQLYFMSQAQMFCNEGNSEDVEHDDVKLRLNEIVMNSKDFAEAFKCAVGSNMNPEVKCSYV